VSGMESAVAVRLLSVRGRVDRSRLPAPARQGRVCAGPSTSAHTAVPAAGR